jgi:hypothetical protein
MKTVPEDEMSNELLDHKVPFEDMLSLAKTLQRNQIVWCWGARGWTNVNNHKALKFRVNGRLFKGFVYITVNGLDLFDIYFTKIKSSTIVNKAKDIYLEDLIETIDKIVETP